VLSNLAGTEKHFHRIKTMPDNITKDKKINKSLIKISEFIEQNYFNKIINRLTDYAEILTEPKLSSIINFNYRLDSLQTGIIIDLLTEIQALSSVYDIAAIGSKDIDEEYVSNIISDTTNPSDISSYINLRNILENKLNQQLHQYNMNMSKNNTTLAIPLNELRGHVKTYIDLSRSNVTVSTKAYHGFIAASLHDAYITLLNRTDWWNDRTYMKYFFWEEDLSQKQILIINKKPRISLSEIKNNIQEAMETLPDLKSGKTVSKNETIEVQQENQHMAKPETTPRAYTDKLLMTPFGRQYGSLIDNIVENIFSQEKKETLSTISDEIMQNKINSMFRLFSDLPNALSTPENNKEIINIVDFLLFQEYGIKTFVEKFLYTDYKTTFLKFYSGETKEIIEIFETQTFIIYFEHNFKSLFRVIKSLDMKKFAC